MRNINIYFFLFCFSIFSFVNGQEEQRDWVAFSQFLDLEVNKDLAFELTASVKTNVEGALSEAGLWVRVDNKRKKMGFFDNMSDRPIKDSEWKTYSIKGKLDSKAQRLNFGGLCTGNGEFYFDDFKLFIENPKTGKMEEVEIDNPSFEDKVKDNEIPKWWIGIRKDHVENVEGFTALSSEESSEGDFSLKIQGKNINQNIQFYIGPIDGYSPQIGTLITMLNNLSERIEYTVGGMTQAELDYQLDDKSNSIAALLMHLIATERYYQEATLGNQHFSAEEMEKLTIAMELGESGRKNIKGQDVAYYLDKYKEGRKKTMELLKEKNDEWLSEVPEGSKANNHYAWFHVMEHQSSHLGQILLLQKRISKTDILGAQKDKNLE